MISGLVGAAAQDWLWSSSSSATAGRAPAAQSRADAAGTAMTPEQQRQVQALANIDRQVRQHEQAHLAVGRDLVRGGASYEYQQGPDGKRYAVAGEVSIDASPASTPEKTIPKAIHIRNTALAPADPSAQDQSVAASAARMEAEARQELARLAREGGTAGPAAAYSAVARAGSEPGQASQVNTFA
ncbi:putative metalloprotease CJM1_0395 family protein [Rhodocyclus tenuis]|uniref:putative metalloprotease CJM1_0395 family protein n=1 Tax=Rhodocyclus tenuis TaxID=1066 RepID=UPI001906297C|nr:putative metalloprotease CJM1_0395 family protein [Rhodocyclus tenuis]MBK1679361.1 hypothetical protein [Rhodocyclus tenuis]